MAWIYSSDVLDAFRGHAAFAGNLPLLRTVAKLFTATEPASPEAVQPLLPALAAMAADASDAGRRARVSMMSCDVVAHIAALWGNCHGVRQRESAEPASAAKPVAATTTGFAKGTGYGSGPRTDGAKDASTDDYARRKAEKHAISCLCLDVLQHMVIHVVREFARVALPA